MGGMKTFRGVVLCAAPCCANYEEVTETPPGFEGWPAVYCKKIRKERRIDTDLDTMWNYFYG